MSSTSSIHYLIPKRKSKVNSPSHIFEKEIETQSQNPTKSELYFNTYNRNQIGKQIHTIYDPHHLTEKAKIIRSKKNNTRSKSRSNSNSKSLGGRTRRKKNKNKTK